MTCASSGDPILPALSDDPAPGIETARMRASIASRLFDAGPSLEIGRFSVLERIGAGGMGTASEILARPPAGDPGHPSKFEIEFPVRIGARHPEEHYTSRSGWLRAAVMGANDGIVSTASLVVGVAAAHATRGDVMIAGIAGLVAGAMSMAAGEYVSVSSQADSEKADLARERTELETRSEFERSELAAIYVARGLEAGLARQVAEQLMTKDALAAHARDELGLSDTHAARPIQAALASAATFSVGAALPLLAVVASPPSMLIALVSGSSLVFLAVMGAVAARIGGARVLVGAGRVAIWGAVAMAATAGVGALFGRLV